MRKDFQISLICAVTSLPAGLAMSLAAEYFSFLKGHQGAAFWISFGITIFLLTLAAVIAIRGERAAEREGAKKRMIPLVGMILFGIGFIGCTAWYFLPTSGDSQQTHEGAAQSTSSVAPASRIVVTKYLIAPVVPTDPKSDLSWQIYMMNRGAIQGYTPQFAFMSRLADSILTEAEIDNGMLEIIKMALKTPPYKKQQIEVNQEAWFPINDRLMRSTDFDAIKNGQKRLYVWVVLAFTDESLPPNKFWVSEFCGTQSSDITSIQICRQRTYLHG